MHAVFGVTLTVAREKANKQIKEGKATLKDFSNDLEVLAQYVFSKMKPIRLSCVYSNRSEAEQYFDMVEGASRNIVIKKRIKSNKVSKKTGETLLKWVVA